MALAGSSTRFLCNTATRTPCPHILPCLSSPRPRKLPFTVSATPKKLSSSRIGKFDSKNRRGGPVPTDEPEKTVEQGQVPADVDATAVVDDGFVTPKLPGDETDFWEGPQWDAFGFFIQYMWAFGVLFALIACGIAVVTYNEGATDFKETPVYREAIQSRELLEGPDASNSDVFESNPTEQAPSLE